VRFLLLALPILGIIWSVSAAADTDVKKEDVKKELAFLANDGVSRENETDQIWNLSRKDGAKFGGPGTGQLFILALNADGSGTIRSSNETWEVTISVDPSKKLKTMDIEYHDGPHKDKKQFAIYKLEKERLTILATKPGAAAKDRPASFDKRDVAKTTLLQFDRNHLFSIQ
jgi:uncharacterized protein (TIGR03067 family)